MKLEPVDIMGDARSGELRASHATAPAAIATESLAIAVDFCSGLGGLSLAAHQLKLAITAAIDTDGNSLKTFAHNFVGAVTVKATMTGPKAIEACRAAIQKHPDSSKPLVALSGPPCQGFSPAGSRDPKDRRNKVLLGVARGITALRPTCALVENVQELLTDKHRGRVDNFKKHLLDAGYHVLSVELNAKDYGVAQTRDRAFFLITRNQLEESAVRKRLKELELPEVTCGSKLDDLPPARARGEKYDDEVDARRPYPNHFSMRHSVEVRKKIRAIPVGRGPMSYRKLDPTKPANTLFSGHRAPPAHYRYARSITVREAARLQGFPDSFAIRGDFSNQMQQVSNAVPPPLARAVLQVLLEFSGISREDRG